MSTIWDALRHRRPASPAPSADPRPDRERTLRALWREELGREIDAPALAFHLRAWPEGQDRPPHEIVRGWVRQSTEYVDHWRAEVSALYERVWRREPTADELATLVARMQRAPLAEPSPTHWAAIVAEVQRAAGARALLPPLRLRDGVWVDRRGPVLPLVCHYGDAFAVWVRRPELVRRQLDAIREAGYDGIRFWDVLGYYAFWRGREVTPWPFTGQDGVRVGATPRYYEQLAEFVEAVVARDLLVHWSRGDMNAWTPEQRLVHIERVATLAHAVRDHVALSEVCNEAWQNGVPDVREARALAARFRRICPGPLVALSAPVTGEGPEGLRMWASPDGFAYVHGHRGVFGDVVRHIFSLAYEGYEATGLRPAWQGEPIGPGASVASLNDPEALWIAAGVALMTGQVWTYMSGRGVRSDGQPIEEEPGFRVVPTVRPALPPDVGTWRTYVHGGDRFRGQRVFAAVEHDDGWVRVDQVFGPAGQVVAIVYGPTVRERTVAIPVERDWRGAVIGPDGREDVVARAGTTLPLRFRAGRLLVGGRR